MTKIKKESYKDLGFRKEIDEEFYSGSGINKNKGKKYCYFIWLEDLQVRIIKREEKWFIKVSKRYAPGDEGYDILNEDKKYDEKYYISKRWIIWKSSILKYNFLTSMEAMKWVIDNKSLVESA